MTDEVKKAIKLDIGAGLEPYGEEGEYIRVDLYVDAPGYIQTPIWDLSMFANNYVDEIYSSHTLEHVSKKEVILTLKEWHRVLKPGGKLVLEVPDLVWCLENWLRRRTDDWHLDTIFGCQDTEGQFHKTGFTIEILQKDLAEAGFKRSYAAWTVWSHAQNTIHIETTK